MDPLSVTASIITVLGTAGFLKRELERLKSRMNPDLEFLRLMNTVTDVQQTLMIARELEDAIKTSKAPAAQRSYRDLPGSINRLQGAVDELANFVMTTLLRKGKGLSRLSLSESKKIKLSELRGQISEAHRTLQFIVNSANTFQGHSLLATVEEAAIEFTDHHTRTSNQLEHLISQVTSLRELVKPQEKNQDTASETESSVESVGSTADDTPDNGLEGSASPSMQDQHLRVTVSMPFKSCKLACPCQCHIRSRFQTPRWLQSVVGLLFYTTSQTPKLDVRPCDSDTCSRSLPSSSTQLVYYFPTWIMRSVLFVSTFRSLEGVNSSWTVRMPRVVPGSVSSWHYIRAKNTDAIKDLLCKGEMSPYDVDTNGVSMLRCAINCWSLDICSILTAAGADWNFKDRFGKSPADLAWCNILAYGANNPHSIKLRSILSSDDSTDLNLNILHQIITGICFGDIRKELERDPSQIDQGDWEGMTPLMWAACMMNDTVVRLLLAHGANVRLQDQEGRTALHYAAQARSFECASLLLIAQADPRRVDLSGWTPLHDLVVTRSPFGLIEKFVAAFKDYGADLNAKDYVVWSPLHVAVEFGNVEAIEALVTSGADMNALNDYEYPPLVRAIFKSEYNCLESLCRLGASFHWKTTSHNVDNVFKYVALSGTVESMNILARSDGPRLDYDPREIMDWFTFGRSKEFYYGERLPEEVELAAFQNLLAAKGYPIHKMGDDTHPDSDTNDPGSQGVSDQTQLNDESIDEDEDEDEDEGEGEDSESEIFVEALEDLFANDSVDFPGSTISQPVPLSA